MLKKAALFVISALISASVAVGGCLQDGGTILQSLNCTALPTIDKYYDPATFSWGGSNYLTVSSGNDLKVWRTTNPTSPLFVASSRFGVAHQGDSDHDLVNYSICDNCRWGIASFHLGNMIFDLGSGASPVFSAKYFYPSSNPSGGFVFKYGDQQYLIANKMPGDCGGDATLYKISGLTNIVAIGCLDIQSPIPVRIFNGVKIESGGSTYLYLGFTNFGVYIYRVEQSVGGISLVNTGHPPLVAFMGRGKGLSVDHGARIAVTASYNNGLKIYDVSNPANPIQRSVVPGLFTAATVKYPFVWAARGGFAGTERAFLIKDVNNPVEMDRDFWDVSNPWNSHSPDCESPSGAVFSEYASVMYFARSAVFQKILFSSCQDPIIPTEVPTNTRTPTSTRTPTPTPPCPPCPTCPPAPPKETPTPPTDPPVYQPTCVPGCVVLDCD